MATTLLTSPTATPNQPESTIVLTSGSTTRIKAPAERVFEAILNTEDYNLWNTWCPELTFPENQSIRQPGSIGTLHCWMAAQNRTYDVPVKIPQCCSSPDRSVLCWQGQLMPSWLAVAERMQVIEKISDSECELRQWESMSGWGAYQLKWLMGIQKQLNDGNLLYANDLKKHAEKERVGSAMGNDFKGLASRHDEAQIGAYI